MVYAEVTWKSAMQAAKVTVFAMTKAKEGSRMPTTKTKHATLAEAT